MKTRYCRPSRVANQMNQKNAKKWAWFIAVLLCSLMGISGPAQAQAFSWSIAIEQNAMSTSCGSQNNIPVPGATSLSAALSVATNFFNANLSCLTLCKAPNTTVVTGPATGFADPYVVNGNPRTRYQVTQNYTCAPPPPAAKVSFTIRKTTAPVLVSGTYTFSVACNGSSGPSTYPVTVTLPGGLGTVSVPAGDTCTVTEAVPAPATSWNPPTFTGGGGLLVNAGQPWAAQVGPVTAPGGALLVTNTRKPLEPTGAISISKEIVNPYPALPTFGPFQVQVGCSPGGPNTIVALTMQTPSQVLNVPAGSSCKIEEIAPAAPAGCQWITTYPNGQTGQNGDKLVVRNELKCAPPPPAAKIPFTIRKTTGDVMIAGNYAFTVACDGAGGPSTYSVVVVLPGGLSTVNVPAGDICVVTETAPAPAGSWNPPIFSGSGVQVTPSDPWQAKVGPVTNPGGAVLVRNSKKKGELVAFDIRKSTGAVLISGTYVFSVACTGPGGPYTGGPVSVMLPSPGFSTVNVPAGSTCTVTESPPASAGTWNPPTFSGSGIAVSSSLPWKAEVGPVTSNGGVLRVTNSKK